MTDNIVKLGQVDNRKFDLSQTQAVVMPPELEELIVVPTTEEQNIFASKGKYFKDLKVEAVTSDIDKNIQENNIRQGVTILGKTGNLAPDKPDQSKTTTPTKERQVVKADTGFELYENIVEPIPDEYEDVRAEVQEQNTYVDEIEKVLEGQSIGVADVSDTTAVASDVASGKIFYTAGGVRTEGTYSEDGWKPNPTWWDIEKILEESEDVADYPIKTIWLLSDTGSSNSAQISGKYKFSDMDDIVSGGTHTWDKTKDKQCYEYNPKTKQYDIPAYKTRYVLLYSKTPVNFEDYTAKNIDLNCSLFIVEKAPVEIETTYTLNLAPSDRYTPLQAFISKNIIRSNKVAFNGGNLKHLIGGVKDLSSLKYSSTSLTEVLGSELKIVNFVENATLSQVLNNTNIEYFEFKTSTKNVTSFSGFASGATKLHTLLNVDLVNATNVSNIVNSCYSLTVLQLKNIRLSIQIGNSVTYGHLLGVSSLINIIQELWDMSADTSTNYTLTMGSYNTIKLNNVYVKLIDVTDEMRAKDEYIDNKKPFIVCESTDDGAMLIKDYMTLKNWKLA